MASNFTTDQLKKMLQENQDKLDSLDSSDIVASKDLKKSVDKISKLLLRTEKGILKELKESNKKSKKDKEETKEEIKSQFEDSRKDFKNRFSEFAQKNKLSMSSIRESYIENINEISEDYKKNLKRAFSDLKVNMSNDILENQKVIEQYLNNFASFITEKTTRAFNIAFNFLKTNMINAFGKIKGLVTSLGDKLGSVIKGTWDRLKGAISHPIESIKNMISNSLSYVWQGIKAVGTLVKNVFVFVLKKIWEGLKWVAGAIWSVVKGVFKAIWTVVSWIGKSIFFMFKWISTFLLKVIWGSLVKITSFLLSAIWEGIKAVGSFLISIMWGTIKAIAKTVFQIAFTIIKSIATMVVSLITSALAPWLGLIAVVGAGVYLLGYWMGWWGNKGNKETAGIAIGGQNIKQGGFFENIGNWLVEKGGKFYKWIKEILFGDETTNSKGLVGTIWDGIKSFFNITGDFFVWLGDKIWGYLTDFWAWIQGKPTSKDKQKIEELEAEKDRLNAIISDPKVSQAEKQGSANEIRKIVNEIDEIQNQKNTFGSIVDFIVKWWNETAKPAIINTFESIVKYTEKIIYGGVDWRNPSKDSLLGWIFTAVFGTNSINWDSPSNDSFLGKIYNLFFGKNSIDWGTTLGLWGNLKEFTLLKILSPIIDTIENYIVPFTEKVFFYLGKIISYFSKEVSESTANAGRIVVEKVKETTQSARQGTINFIQKKLVELPLTTSDEDISNLNKEKALLENKQLQTGKMKKETVSSYQKLVSAQYLNLFRTLFNISMATDKRNDLLVNEEGLTQEIKRIALSSLDLNALGYSEQFNKLPLYNKEFLNPIISNIIKGTNPYSKNELNDLRTQFSDFKDKGIINDILFNSINSMLTNIDTIQDGIKNLAKTNMHQAPGDDINDTIYHYVNRMLPNKDSNYVGLSKIDKWLFKDPSNIKSMFGLARGGIVKPQPQGVNIIAAEAGSPEVILPLNRQGLTFIDEISKRLDYTSEHKEDMVNDIVTKLTKVIKDTVKSDKKETYATSTKQPVFLEDKSESSQLTKLLAMGMLNGR